MKNAPNFVLDDAEISFANYDEIAIPENRISPPISTA